MKESIVSLECWTLPKQTTKSDHLCKWSTVQHQVSHVFWNQLSRENAQNSGFCWVPSMCFIQGREVLQKQDYGLVYRLSEMVIFNPTLLQFIMTKKGLGSHPPETLYPHIHPWNIDMTTAYYNNVVYSVPINAKNHKKMKSLENNLPCWQKYFILPW